MHSTNKCSQPSLKPKNPPTRREAPKKAIITRTESLAPSKDFVLFPDNALVEKHASTRFQRSQRVRKELIADGLLPSANNDHHGTEDEKLTPLRRAAKRHSMLQYDRVTYYSEELQWKEIKLPPAPSPPRLGTPDLDDIDEDLWTSCSWSQSTVESYIAGSRESDGMNRSVRQGARLTS